MNHKTIKLLRLSYLRGPNLWTYRPAMEALIDIGDLEDCPSNTLPGFYERLTAWLPGLVEHHCGVGERGGFLLRLREGTWPGHIMEHVALELQNLAGMQTGFGKARSTEVRGVYKVVIRTRQEEVGCQALLDARDLVMAAIEDTPFDVAAAVRGLKALIDRHALGPSTASIVDAASQRQIPAIRLTTGNLVQLGYGSKQRRIWTAETDKTSAIAESISRDKDLTKRLLAACGVPIPQGQVVTSPAEAWEVAQDIGLPVVVKPSDANHGRGVSLDLSTQAAVEAAYALADAEGSDVIVERFIPGQEHRLLVVGNRVVAAARGEQACITGDGRSTVMALIEAQINTDPRRGEEEEYPLDTIRLPENSLVMLELSRQGLTPDSVPAAGQVVLVQRTGVMTHDITDEVHPEVAEMAALAARVVGLDIAGIDLVATDIAQPLEAQGGAIVEVNAGPGLLMHLKPAVGQPRPVGEAIVEHLFGPRDNGRIPVVGITGTQGTTPVALLLGAVMHRAGLATGVACSDGLYVQMQRIDCSQPSDWEAGQRTLMNRCVDAAVLENSPRSILDDGLSYDRCQVGVVTDVPLPSGLQDHHILDRDQMRTVLRTQVDVVLPQGCAVLNADDAVCAGLAELCDGDVIFYSQADRHDLQAAHCDAGRRFLLVQQAQVVLWRNHTATPLLDLTHPAVADLLQHHLPLSALLAAVGAALALDLPPPLVRAGVETAAPFFAHA
ncbi:cyanophycin synthetase [Aquabacterium sp. A08]|uniref:cyanophycin synthetase n=1 Tax=Aquabacterium sp. A08 TaxID=2718532 RepID=UPI0014247F22|nr:cyanophycin synthetase [Aquabacterium sp. A08]NIC43550.1 cyanophycin synthetase [Aquabacterium sp. A08]